MAKVADVKLKWTKSPSSDVDKARLTVTVNGTDTVTELDKAIEEFVLEISANSAVQFKIDTFDSEGLQSTSAVYSFTLGDLEAPFPATNLAHEILAIRDV